MGESVTSFTSWSSDVFTDIESQSPTAEDVFTPSLLTSISPENIKPSYPSISLDPQDSTTSRVSSEMPTSSADSGDTFLIDSIHSEKPSEDSNYPTLYPTYQPPESSLSPTQKESPGILETKASDPTDLSHSQQPLLHSFHATLQVPESETPDSAQL